MKPGHANAHFIADAHDHRIALAEMRARWKAGDYGAVRPEYARDGLRWQGAPMADEIIAFQVGREAAMEGRPRDGRRCRDWLEG